MYLTERKLSNSLGIPKGDHHSIFSVYDLLGEKQKKDYSWTWTLFICVFFYFPVMTHHDPARAREPLTLPRFEPRIFRITGYPANHCTTVDM
ncbi:hypothetical protein OUZ56_021411 [Daphnia magna]|uniref:Uncharacterized protein n=1 Tax=Daphnia magna TaxID=35525 RepID=A0ABQ9ZHC0_9CRUS|nr:hypothetical protein OUZ56_021411 [Daphnia magna]